MINDYRARIMPADVALAEVQSGQRVYIHNGCAEPVELVKALTRRGPDLADVEILHMATMGIADYTLPQYAGHFRHNALFIGGNVRKAVQEGRADYTPVFLSEIEGLLSSGALPIDICLLQCTPPDHYGYMSLGPSIDASLTAAQVARHVIVQINPMMPRTLGDTFLHVSRVDAFVEASHPLAEYPSQPISSLHHDIARHVAPLIPDGATIQTGIGGIPEAVLGLLRDHKDLGIHSEMVPDSVVALMQAGVINNERKTIHRHKAIAGFVLGSRLLFDFIDNNPSFEFHRTAYANDPFVIAQNDRMVAINSAIEVDLTGQVCADSMGQTPYSGIGGQVDFLRGAARSRGGLPIIALPSTAKKGTLSRIVPRLQPGAGVVTSRGDVHYVITEHGVAYLHGKTLRQRAEALIAIADPSFREELEAFAIETRLLGPDHARVAVVPPIEPYLVGCSSKAIKD
jgi:4-hydroxybutyrate CoA-transferase